MTGYDPPPSEFRTQPATMRELEFRHRKWCGRRQQVWDSLLRTHASSRVLERFAECGAALSLLRRDDGNEHRLSCDKCRNRACMACGAEQGAILAENIAVLCSAEKTRLVTLTLRCNTLSLSDQLDRLYACFGQLRRRAWWKANVEGGAAFCEIKLGKFSDKWHVHMHILVHGSYLDQKKLSTEWLACTGDSSVVHVTLVKDLGDACRYVAKYVTKPLDHTVFANTETLDEALLSLKGRRLCLTFGEWRGKPLREVVDDGHVWTKVTSLDRLWAGVRHGEADSASLITHACNVCPSVREFFNGCFALPPPPPVDDDPF